jgi:hypothetical protein
MNTQRAERIAVRKLSVNERLTLDGVIQAPAGRGEKRQDETAER